MNTHPLVSIVIPAFNAEKVLVDALDSVRGQTYTRWEALVVDDGSTDRTAQVAEEYAGADPRIRLLQQANAGSAIARNTALKEARGELIAFLDADDMWFATKLERQVQLVRADPGANFFFTNYWVWNGCNDRSLRYATRGEFPEGDLLEQLYCKNVFGTSTVMVRRETLEHVGFFDPELRHVHDWDLWLRIAEMGGRTRGVWKPQARYRIWPGNVTANRVRNATYAVRVLEKAAARAQTDERVRHSRRGLRIARARLELAGAQSHIVDAPDTVAPAVLRAWRCYPRHTKWLVRYVGLVWPTALGGSWTSRMVIRTIQEWQMGWRLEQQPAELSKQETR